MGATLPVAAQLAGPRVQPPGPHVHGYVRPGVAHRPLLGRESSHLLAHLHLEAVQVFEGLEPQVLALLGVRQQAYRPFA